MSSQSGAAGAPRGHQPALDGFRGLAILMVFVFHAVRVETGGWMGVDLFFVLSGFLITGILVDSANGPRYFRNFYVRRALRIFPLFYGVLALLVVLTPLLRLQWRLGHLSFLFFCQNIAMNADPSLVEILPAVSVIHLWSLAVEEQFYLIWPLLVWWVRDSRKLMRLCLWLMGGGLVLRLAVLGAGLAFHRNFQEWIYMELPTHWDGLVLGSWLAMAVRRWPMETVRRRMRAPFWLAVLTLTAVVAGSRSLGHDGNAMCSIGYTAIAVVFAGVLLRALTPGSGAAQFFSLRPLRFLGKYSYGIYVYHRLFGPALLPGLYWLQSKLHSAGLGALLYLAAWFAGSVGIAVASYHLWEQPFLRLKDRLAPSRSGQTGERPEGWGREGVEAEQLEGAGV